MQKGSEGDFTAYGKIYLGWLELHPFCLGTFTSAREIRWRVVKALLERITSIIVSKWVRHLDSKLNYLSYKSLCRVQVLMGLSMYTLHKK